MKFYPRRPGACLAVAALFFVAAAAVFAAGCSAMPVTQGTLDEVQADQAATIQAAESGNTLRTAISGVLALLGAVGVAVARQRAYDAKPFQGKVAGREVTATEDEVLAVVEKARSEGSLKA